MLPVENQSHKSTVCFAIHKYASESMDANQAQSGRVLWTSSMKEQIGDSTQAVERHMSRRLHIQGARSLAGRCASLKHKGSR